MATGYPDWTQAIGKTEVVIRPVGMFTGGRVMFLDDFESALMSWTVAGTAGKAAAIDTSISFTKTACLKLTPGSTSDYLIAVSKYIGVPYSDKIGVSVIFALPILKGAYFHLSFAMIKAPKSYTMSIRYDVANTKWQYYNTAAAWVDIPGGTQLLLPFATYWHNVKFVADFSTEKYMFMICDGKYLDLSSLSMRVTARPTGFAGSVTMLFYATDNTQPLLYVDDVIVTDEG